MTVDAPSSLLLGNMDVDEFMAFFQLRPDGEHWELIEGVAVLMAPASLAQRRIALNFCNLLNGAFQTRYLNLFAYMSVCLRAPGVRNFQPQPDVAVVPGVVTYEYYSERFQLAAEVLSPTNPEEIDLKLRRYCEAPDNLYLVVIEPRAFRVEVYAKLRGWKPLILTDAGDTIEMPEFGLRCTVADLYRGTLLNPRADDA